MSLFRSSILALALALSVLATSVAGGTANAGPGGDQSPAVGLRLAAEGLTSPVDLVPVPDGSGRLFVVDQVGLIRILRPNGTLESKPFLDIRDRIVALTPSYDERGLLGLAFHPDYAHNGRFFVYYSAPPRPGAPAGFNTTSTVSEFHVSATDPDHADAGSERTLLQVDKPQSNHNAGTLLFGPDHDLYISIGDGGGANDV
ncbi:MAG: PQQ-dependent sugar dehydrogenase, partial [Acidothermales bacterium]|nr:PQQ-dependent sugar dehydrogenase [Acidothermales bacterium]